MDNSLLMSSEPSYKKGSTWVLPVPTKEATAMGGSLKALSIVPSPHASPPVEVKARLR